MKVLVVGDVHVDADYYADQIQRLPWKEPAEIKKFSWFPKDAQEFQEIALKIEKEGPENIPFPEAINDEIETADALFTHFCPVSRKLIAKSRQLKLIGTCRGGVEHISPEAQKRDIEVINVVRNAEPVADFTLGLILSELRNISRGHASLAQGKWEKNFLNKQNAATLSSLKIGLIGFGEIGQIVARQLTALGASVLVFDLKLSEDDILKKNSKVTTVPLEHLLKNSDVVSLHVRFEKDIPPIIDAGALAKMKPNCILVNTSRAYAVNQKDLVKALESRQIGGAALDVFWDEPLSEDSPLRKLPNVTLTPHMAGDTAQAIPLSPKMLIEKIAEMQKEHSFPFFKAE